MWGHAWEIWWGVGVIGLICTALTLYYAPSRWILGWVVAFVFLVAGYYVWLAHHVRLIPQLALSQLLVVPVPPENPEKVFAQVLVETAADGMVDDCQAQLLKISKWSPHKQDWDTTSLNETTDLLWSVTDETNITVEPGAPRRLNLFVMYRNAWAIYPWAVKKEVRIPIACGAGDMFRLDIRVGKPGFRAENASLKLTITHIWDKFQIEELAIT